MSADGGTYVHALALGLDPAWRRLPDTQRLDDAGRFRERLTAGDDGPIRTFVYSSIGLESGVDLLLWRFAPSVDALEESAAELLAAGMGRWLTVSHSLIGRIGPSQYVRKPTGQEQSPLICAAL